MNHDYEQHSENNLFFIRHATTSVNKPYNFILHQHTHPEIYIFVSGSASFIYEGSTYTLSPYDIMLVPPNTLHRPIPQTYSTYTRYILHPYLDFYSELDCKSFSDFFVNIDTSSAKIPAEKVKETDIINILHKILKYSNDLQNINKPIITYLFYEICYILSTIPRQKSYTAKNTVVQDIIGYINENYKYIENISEISEALNYSVSHICMLFKKNEGITIHDYIISKRLSNVDSLYRKGETLTSACMNSGFSSYNNFAYTYKKKYKKSPKENYKN